MSEPLMRIRVPHLVVEDCWYSCPKSGDCCDDHRDPNVCNCGADALNERIDQLFARADRLEAQCAEMREILVRTRDNLQGFVDNTRIAHGLPKVPMGGELAEAIEYVLSRWGASHVPKSLGVIGE